MRRPAQHRSRPTTAPGWAHPYTGITGIATFYNDGGGNPDPTDPPKPGPPPTPAPATDPVKQFTQDDLDRIAAKEKAQGKRSALKEFAEQHGFNTVEDAEAFITAARQAQKDALTEEERRRQELDEREQQLAARETASLTRERAAIRKAALVTLGATGPDLEDALALLEHDLRNTPDADEETVTAAAEALKERRSALFGAAASGQQPQHLPPAPGGAPAGGAPRPQATKDDVKARAEARARQMGFRRDAA
ncbi:hypothetical protein [Streptomyces sp. AD55]|uniref:hypothetical protein n=1 Tax=Streptomyces sp. AD55 TaxID=3242895 RepID=UPI003527B139